MMEKGIIYLMTTIVPGLVKIGKTNLNGFDQRMYNLEHNGYCNVTGLKREFAIELENYSEKERLLHTIFEKSRVGDTELFAIDVDIVNQLLSSFEGDIIYPKDETKTEIFTTAVDREKSELIPDGIYYFKRKKVNENKDIIGKARITNGSWTLLAGSVLGLVEGIGGSRRAKLLRNQMMLDSKGTLLEDFELGKCTPSFAAVVLMNQAANGWMEWANNKGQSIDVYRK